jgi:hypothetical protein
MVLVLVTKARAFAEMAVKLVVKAWAVVAKSWMLVVVAWAVAVMVLETQQYYQQ